MQNTEIPLVTVRLKLEQDVVTARQRARQISAILGLDHQDQVRVATAVSEVARNAFVYAGGGKAEFFLCWSPPATLGIRISDTGPGIANLPDILSGNYQSSTGMGVGLAGAHRLMDRVDIGTGAGQGTRIAMFKRLPNIPPAAQSKLLGRIASELASQPPNVFREMTAQNQEMIEMLQQSLERQSELARLNQELEETNRGVLALYSELDDKAASLKAASELKSKFLSHMSHEFRTPLNSILGLAGLLEQRMDGELTQEQEKQVLFIRKAAEDLYEMVNDLLDLAKVEAGKTDIQCQDVDVRTLLSTLRGMMRPVLNNPHVELLIDEPQDNFMLFTDERRVSQILRNLVSNALKFTERGSVRVSFRLSDGIAAFEVRDTGLGIGERDHERIFQEFGQINNPIQKRVKGTGLGLPLSRKLAELLEGSLTVSSQLGQGSTFTLRLPVIGRSHGLSGDRTVIAVISPDRSIRARIRTLFPEVRYAVTEIAEGTVAVEQVRFERPKLILLHLEISGQGGFGLLRELKNDPDSGSVPVIIVSSRTLGREDLVRLNGGHSAIISEDEIETPGASEILARILGDDRLLRGSAQRKT